MSENERPKTDQVVDDPQLRAAKGAPEMPPSAVVPPSLSAFYADPKSKPLSFLKAIKVADVKAFDSDDIMSAQTMLADRDPTFARTLQLGLASRAPDVVERWVMDVARSSVRSLDPETMADGATSPEGLFERIVRLLADALESKNKTSRVRAQNLVKLSLLWLVRTRSLDPLQSLYALTETNKHGLRDIRSQVQKILVRAQPGQWKILSAVARLSSDAVQRADRAATDAGRARDRLQERVVELEKVLQQKQEEVEQLFRGLEQAQAEASAAKSALGDEQRLRELDLAQAAGRTRHFLNGRLNQLVSDARIALDFDPPHIEAAQQRLDLAKEIIAQQVKDSHD